MKRKVIEGKVLYVYTSYQSVEGGGSRNCMDWIMDAQWAGADKVVIELPYASPKLIKKIAKYALKISGKLGGFPVEVVQEFEE